MLRLCFWLLLGLAALMGRLLFVMLAVPGLSQTAGPVWPPAPRSLAELEHLQLVQTDDGRGRILFRNGAPWSGTWENVRWSPGSSTRWLRVHTELTERDRQVDALVGQVGRPDVWPDRHRVVAEQGRSGLEAAFDTFLRAHRPGYVGILRDPKGAQYPEQTYLLTSIRGADVRTTVDPVWQAAAIRALRETGVSRAAAVVLDVASGDALAVAGVTPERWAIPALRAETPGSVFKLVTAAAALDSWRFRGVSSFYCTGELVVPAVHMRCWSRHGRETLLTALADSCDVSFARVGMTLGHTALEREAELLHLNTTQLQELFGHPLLAEAESGVVFRRADDDPGRLANTAIGQQDVRMTPLQAANLARTIATGGGYRPVRVVMRLERDGQTVQSFRTPPDRAVMSAATAARLAYGMRLAVVRSSGTAHVLSDLPVEAAVKTGTAELGTGRVNGWMVGFAPYRAPRIAFAVYVGDEPSTRAHDAVRQIARRLLETYRQFQASRVIP